MWEFFFSHIDSHISQCGKMWEVGTKKNSHIFPRWENVGMIFPPWEKKSSHIFPHFPESFKNFPTYPCGKAMWERVSDVGMEKSDVGRCGNSHGGNFPRVGIV